MNPTVTITPVVAGVAGSLELLLGSVPAIASSDGGWAVVNRPKNVSFTAWEGYAPHQLSLNVLFDGFSQGASQETRYESLHRMMRTPVGAAKQPSPVRLAGPIPMTNLLWVIQSIDQDPRSIIRGDKGELLRVAVTISLLEYVEADVLVAAAVPSPAVRLNQTIAAASPAPPPTSGRTHTVQYGDTLWAIAQKELGAGKRYTEIAELNGIRDPNNVPVGTVLKIP